MAEQMLTKEELEASKGATGRIVRIVGPVVDVEVYPLISCRRFTTR